MNKTEIAGYSATETLRDGRQVIIRAIRTDDTVLMADALRRVSPESLYQRTFSARKTFSDKELVWLVSIDFERIVSLVVVMRDQGRDVMVGEGRYVRLGGAAGTTAEVAFLVSDEHKGIGIGSLIFRHLAVIARSSGVTRFEAEMLGWNDRMMRLFVSTGLPVRKDTAGRTVRVAIEL